MEGKEMININKSIANIESQISTESSWDDLAYVINFATNLQRVALDIAIRKGIKEGLEKDQIIYSLVNAGCKMDKGSLRRLIDFHDFKIELNLTCHGASNLREPENEGQFRALGKSTASTSALEKAEEFTEMYEDKGSAPSNREIAEANAKKAALKKKLNKKEELGSLPQYLGVDEIQEFRGWLLDEKGFDYEKEKPKVPMQALVAQRDEILDELYAHVGEWKSARKIMGKLLHPDTGGNTLAFQFYQTFDKLMNAMVKLVELLDYEEALLEYKKEWWESRQAKIVYA